MDHVVKDSGNGAMISGTLVLKAELHVCIVDITHGCLEASLLGITKVPHKLVITTESVY